MTSPKTINLYPLCMYSDSCLRLTQLNCQIHFCGHRPSVDFSFAFASFLENDYTNVVLRVINYLAIIVFIFCNI